MKTFLKKFLVFSAILLSTVSVLSLNNSRSVYARTGDDCYFLGLTSWDCNVDTEVSSEDGLKTVIWTIAGNILVDITVIAAYLVVGYAIYGGYLYILSSGDPNKTAAGKKTLTHAFIGLAIVLLANIIINTIKTALGAKNFEYCAQAGSDCITEDEVITKIISWVIGVSGLVAVIFILIGGIGYITSSGDANKLAKAKNTILYALIGLAIVGLAQIIVVFVSNTINDATKAPATPASTTEQGLMPKHLAINNLYSNNNRKGAL